MELPCINSIRSFLFVSMLTPLQGQVQPLNLSCVFSLDSLPVGFGSSLSESQAGSEHRTQLNKAINELSELIWKKGGFRFWHRRTNNGRYIFYCSQDKDRARKTASRGLRDVPRMERFSCGGQLTFTPSFVDRTLAITLRHTHHEPYDNHELSDAVLEFIGTYKSCYQPAEIFRNIQAARPEGWKSVTLHQVYYQWHLANSKNWRRHSDSFLSAQILLSERSNVHSASYVSSNVRGLDFYDNDSIRVLSSHAKELAMDATYGTNNKGMELFAVLAEFDGTGVPLAYCFVDVFENNRKGERNAEPGAIIGILSLFLRPLKDFGLNPTFFGTDKDPAEIFAIGQIWPNTTIQLCCWHAERAVRTRLGTSKEINSQNEYRPLEAQSLVSDLELCWGSLPIRRPDGDHRYGRCACPSRNVTVQAKGRIETWKNDELDTVVEIFLRHFNMHSLIPDQNGTYRSSEGIHRACAAEMYHWCRPRNYFRLWAYFWVNWYQPSQWVLWARSSNPREIPILKTTMILESHWRKVKHDYLHRFNRPRIDIVTWVLLSSVIPDALTRMQVLLERDHRKGRASWRKHFKQEWKKLSSRAEDMVANDRYHTDPAKWTCSCPYFLTSRFLICKHIIACYESIVERIDFFNNVTRSRTSPFWLHPQLVLRPEFRHCENQGDTVISDEDGSEFSEDSEDDASIDAAAADEDNLADPDDDLEEEFDAFESDLQQAVDIFREQRAKGNKKFLEKFMDVCRSMRKQVREIIGRKNQRTMPRTWGSWKHPATMYYQ